jgi:glutamate-1-semialdehyde 2,1-aminomutase
MMNCGVIFPEEGYLQGLKDLLHRHGAFLAFDEVKTGATIAYGGATEWSGVRPDVVALAKAIGGGLPVAAIGGTEEAMRVVVDGTMEQEGTFNGNPLSMAAARATLTRVLTPDVYQRFEALDRILVEGIEAAFARHGLPARVHAVGGRFGIQYRAEPVRDLEDYLTTDEKVVELMYLFQANRGVWQPSSDPMTLSVAHTEEDVRRYVENVEAFAEAIAA